MKLATKTFLAPIEESPSLRYIRTLKFLLLLRAVKDLSGLIKKRTYAKSKLLAAYYTGLIRASLTLVEIL